MGDPLAVRPAVSFILAHDLEAKLPCTNLAEVYNWIMRGARCLPLVGIVEAILRSTTNYFVDGSNNASLAMANDRVL